MDHCTSPSMWSIALEGLSPHEQQQIVSATIARQYSPRALLYCEGEICAHLSIIDSGRVRSFHTTPGGKEFTNLVSGKGALLGLVSIVLHRPVVISIESLDAVTVSQIPTTQLLGLMQTIPRLSFNLNRVLATAYMDGIARGRRSVDAAPLRLAKVLHRLALLDADSPTATGGDIVGITQQDLAAMVDITRSWVAQILGTFESQGLVTCHRRVIRVPDLARLEAHIISSEN